MPSTARHVAINADDLPRARAFYERVFGWTFKPWGPPDFYQADPGEGAWAALQSRRTIAGKTMPGLEVTFDVPDIEAAVLAVEAGGGKVLMPPFHIEGVGHLIWFEDPEGNIAGAMQYDREQQR